MQLSGSFLQSVLHRNLSHESQPMGGVRARPFSSEAAKFAIRRTVQQDTKTAFNILRHNIIGIIRAAIFIFYTRTSTMSVCLLLWMNEHEHEHEHERRARKESRNESAKKFERKTTYDSAVRLLVDWWSDIRPPSQGVLSPNAPFHFYTHGHGEV